MQGRGVEGVGARQQRQTLLGQERAGEGQARLHNAVGGMTGGLDRQGAVSEWTAGCRVKVLGFLGTVAGSVGLGGAGG